MSFIIALALTMSASSLVSPRAAAPLACSSMRPVADDALTESGRLARRVGAASILVRPSVVLVEGFIGQNPRPESRRAGVIITGDGLVLCAAFGEVESLKVLLSDGRRVTGRIVGRSGEWGITLLRLNGDGPWPHVPLDDAAGAKPGQASMVLGFRLAGDGARTTPDLRVETVTSAVPSSWFGMTGGDASSGWLGELAFNLDGGLIGVGSRAYPGGQDDERFYAHVRMIKSFWEDLAGGEDVDLRRLWDAGQRREVPRPFGSDAPIGRAARDRAVAATVRMREATKEGEQPWSGVIVSKDGLIVTCAHHGKRPGVRLAIWLADGRTTTGEVVGINPISDVGLVRITGFGDWPTVDRGDSRRLTPGTPCFVVGYPGELEAGQPPRVGVGMVTPPSHRIAPVGLNFLQAKTDPSLTGGQSGGGLFDPDGHLVAIVQGGNRLDGDFYGRVELVRASSRELAIGAFEGQRGPPALAEAKAELRRRAERIGKSLVTILDGDRPVAVGTIVTRDGGIVTKASVLPKAPSCRLADGHTVPAKIVRVSRTDDLALLRITAADLTAIEGWDSKDIPPLGQLVALPIPGGTTVVGSVTCGLRPIPPAPKDEGARHNGFPRAYEVGIPSLLALSGGPVVDATGRMRGVVAVASEGWAIVIPSSSARAALHD